MKKLVRFAIAHRAINYSLTFLLVLGGLVCFATLAQLEDPVYTIKTATIFTSYPGASPEEVELEVTDRIEIAIKQMSQVKNIYSISRAGESIVKVDIKDEYWSKEIPQVWDELRKKVRDIENKLPPGSGKPLVNDDFGSVYGFLLALTGDGFKMREMEYVADTIKKDLDQVPGVSRVDLYGVQPQVIYLEISENQLSQLGLTRETVLQTLQEQNIVVDAGSFDLKDRRFRVAPTGEFSKPTDIGELNLKPMAIDLIDIIIDEGIDAAKAQEASIVRVQDLAKVERGYKDPPQIMMRYNGMPAIGIQIAGLPEANIVQVGELLDERLKAITKELPIGLELSKVSWQSNEVQVAVDGFIVSFLEALAIVLVVLIIPSGFRMGMIIGFALIITILGTFIYMSWAGIPLQRMSLGALIIALGMMVDNAIVVSDKIAVLIRRGMDRVEAATEAVVTSWYPLFAATVVAVMAFYPIYGSKTSTGEYCGSLFNVVAASLLLSWFVAMFITPLQCINLLPVTEQAEGEYDTKFFRLFRSTLQKILKLKNISLIVLVSALVLSVIGFGFVKQMFFPDSSRPQLMVDFWGPYGTTIQEVSEELKLMEKEFLKDEHVSSVSAFIGAGPPRFYLPVEPERPYQNYGQLIVNFKNYKDIDAFIAKYEPWSEEIYPDAMTRFRKYSVGPANTWKFELRFSAPGIGDLQELRDVAKEATQIVEKSPYGKDWFLDMQNRVLKLVPDYDQKRGRWAGISRADLAKALKRNYDGIEVGIFREGDKLLPIVARNVPSERKEYLDRIDTIAVRPSASTKTVPIAQVVSTTLPDWEDPQIIRWNRKRAVTVQGEPVRGSTFPTLRADVLPSLNQMKLPPGYEMQWYGEQDSAETSQKALIPGMIIAAIVIVFMIVTVFDAFRPLFIILLTIPFALIGITLAFLLLGTPFGFVALLGGMSLAGMMNKNIVVLLDACNENIAQGMTPFNAIVEASVTRLRPVILAAGTTVLGVLPLVPDVFWTAMAVTIMGGLAFGSLLTLIAVPLFYCFLYRVRTE